MIDLPPPGYQQTIEALAQCGVPGENIVITYEDVLQSDEVRISSLGEVNEQKLRCVRAAVHPFYVLTIEDKAQQAAFYDQQARDDRPMQKAAAREWLLSRQLLDRVPSYNPANGIRPFVEELERGCGIERGTALEPVGTRSLTIRRELLSAEKFQESAGSVQCLMQMFSASDAGEHGVSFVFIGNEAFSESNED